MDRLWHEEYWIIGIIREYWSPEIIRSSGIIETHCQGFRGISGFLQAHQGVSISTNGVPAVLSPSISQLQSVGQSINEKDK
jgi:hypothetical protein